MVSHQEVAEPKGGRTEGAEVRPEVWTELLLEVPGMEGTEVRREVEVPLTATMSRHSHLRKNIIQAT